MPENKFTLDLENDIVVYDPATGPPPEGPAPNPITQEWLDEQAPQGPNVDERPQG